MFFVRFSLTVPLLMLMLLLAALCVFPPVNSYFPFSFIFIFANIVNKTFHELGHSIFAFLYGIPNLPDISTIFGTDPAQDVIFMLERRWLLQLIIFGGLGWICYYLFSLVNRFYVTALSFTLFIVVTSFTKYHMAVIDFMGHITAMMIGGYLLYWAICRGEKIYNRMTAAFFGFYILLWNIRFSYMVAYDQKFRDDYAASRMSQVWHHDFIKIHDITGLGVDNVAVATSVAGMAILLLTLIIAGKHSKKA